uniref:M56 family metallopeptidase n=1 Tax=Herbidospora sakaeratensis TaxID=564415 RepID=UPI000784D42F|nr:M56 family metallopeptidase [Herbidospora sakaeratensis]
MIAAVALAALAAVCALSAWRMTFVRWTWRAPRAAIALWQALGLTWGLASVGALLAYALEPWGRGVIHGLVYLVTHWREPSGLQRVGALAAGLALLTVLLAVVVVAMAQTLQARRRHRLLLSLVARDEPAVPGVRVVDHPGAAAYCVPGLKSQVVISEGTLSLLSRDELAAVLAHEDAHARERHDLVLLPFAALRWVLPWSKVVRDANASVALLVEMAADDHARLRVPPKRLATALLRFGTAGAFATPHGALGVGAENVMARVNRLVKPGPAMRRRYRYGIVAGAALLTTSAPLLWFLPQ